MRDTMRTGMMVGLMAAVALGACSDSGMFKPKNAPVQEASAEQRRPEARPAGSTATKPPANARTAAQFDTVSEEEKQAAKAAPADPSGERALGDTVVSLGDPSKPGLWLETPLVSSVQQGRVAYKGESAKIELRPIDGAATAGSRMSLSAMQLIGAPLTDLPTVQVFVGG
ncbi:hypothetical protein [Sagittula sp. NFXS13]|uniref:hypothetical protein n=1 Tax=Sagittula sp. NFXS13 TaxID=2819095 RepID=UPI0032DE55F2